jgi:hypothetical protein
MHEILTLFNVSEQYKKVEQQVIRIMFKIFINIEKKWNNLQNSFSKIFFILSSFLSSVQTNSKKIFLSTMIMKKYF